MAVCKRTGCGLPASLAELPGCTCARCQQRSTSSWLKISNFLLVPLWQQCNIQMLHGMACNVSLRHAAS